MAHTFLNGFDIHAGADRVHGIAMAQMRIIKWT
jgi:hypothetical protein